MKLTLIFISLLSVSCASLKQGKDYTHAKEFEHRPVLTENFVLEEHERLTETQIKNLLSQRVELPDRIKVAVVKLGHDSEVTTFRNYQLKRQQGILVKDDLVQAFEKVKGPQKRIKEFAMVPEILLPSKPGLGDLRNVAALMQADLMLILKTKSKTNSKYHIHKENEAKAIATVEAVTMDIKTGVIPFTSIATNSAHVKEAQDFSSEELYTRATLEAETGAINEIIENLGEYFN